MDESLLLFDLPSVDLHYAIRGEERFEKGCRRGSGSRAEI